MTRLKVNIKLLPVKLHYFAFCAASAAIVPFLPVIGRQMGISEIESGVITAAASVAGLLAKPTVGVIADRLKKRKTLFLFFILLALMTSLCIAFLPTVEPQRPVNLVCGQGANYIKQCSGGTFCGSNLDSIWREKLIREREDFDAKNASTFEYDELKDLVSGSKPELCHVTCNIYTYSEGTEFCQSLEVAKKPKLCPSERVVSNSNSTVSTTLATIDGNTTIAESITTTHSPVAAGIKKMGDDIQKASQIRLEPSHEVLDFDVYLNIDHAEPILDCIYIPIERIGFGLNPEEFQTFSCFSHPEEPVYLRSCFADCPNNSALNQHMERIMGEAEPFQSTTFWLFGLLVVIALAALAVVNSLSDALCFQLLGDKPQLYGRQRLLAAIGWGGSTLIAGYLIDRNSPGLLVKDYTPGFYMLAGLFILDLIMSYKWEIKESDKPKSLRKDIYVLISDLRIIIFFFVCILVGMCTGIHWYFLFWYVEEVTESSCDSNDTRHWLKLLQGIMVAVQCLAEIPFFYYAGWFIKKLGHVHCLSFVLFAFGIRLIIYSCLSNPWAFIPVELFQGITFGLFYSVMATYADKISPPGSHATVQGIVGAGFEGIGIATGSMVAGGLFKTFNGKFTFRIFGIGAIVFGCLHVFIMYFVGKKRIYGIPINNAEVEGQEMYKINGVNHDVETESE